MRQVFLITAGVIFAVSVVVGAFAINQANQEQLELTSRLQSRSQVLADSLAESIEPSYNQHAVDALQKTADKFASNQRLAGLGVFDSSGATIASSETLQLPSDPTFITAVMDRDEPRGSFVRNNAGVFYTYVIPLHESGNVVGALAVVQDAAYIDESIRTIWRDNIIRLVLQLGVFSLAIFVLVRWVFLRAVTNLVTSLQSVRKGDTDYVHGTSFLEPLVGEISKVTHSLRQARHAASEEARMRGEKLDSPWTAERLKEFIKAYLKDRPIYVLSNREPYVHDKTKNGVRVLVPAGGVVTALEPIMEACGGMWIAHGSGSADKENADEKGKLRVPVEEPRYTLKRVWLTPKEVKGYYAGFSSEALWPLCHLAHVRPVFRSEDWTEYRKVNGQFTKALLEEIRHVESPLILVQDYHLALVPAMIKKSRPDARVAMFWHIPWPSAAQFSICPWRKEILEGMLGADVIGFHTQQNCNNFMDTVAAEIESRIDFEQFSIFRDEHRSYIRPFPISIAYPGNAEPQQQADPTILKQLGIHTEYLALGVDRLDYIKGFLERFKGMEFFLRDNPQFRGKVTLLQIASPTRESVEKYREYAALVEQEAARINEEWGEGDWKPIVFEHKLYSHGELQQLYQLADACLVTSLHDGMNLVAKEYVAARTDESGALILSHFAGASRDMKGALLINPYSAEETAHAIREALTMTKTEQHRRMKSMRASVREFNVYRWSAELIRALLQLE